MCDTINGDFFNPNIISSSSRGTGESNPVSSTCFFLWGREKEEEKKRRLLLPVKKKEEKRRRRTEKRTPAHGPCGMSQPFRGTPAHLSLRPAWPPPSPPSARSPGPAHRHPGSATPLMFVAPGKPCSCLGEFTQKLRLAFFEIPNCLVPFFWGGPKKVTPKAVGFGDQNQPPPRKVQLRLAGPDLDDVPIGPGLRARLKMGPPNRGADSKLGGCPPLAVSPFGVASPFHWSLVPFSNSLKQEIHEQNGGSKPWERNPVAQSSLSCGEKKGTELFRTCRIGLPWHSAFQQPCRDPQIGATRNASYGEMFFLTLSSYLFTSAAPLSLEKQR